MTFSFGLMLGEWRWTEAATSRFNLSADSSTWIDIVLLCVHLDCDIKFADNYDFRFIEKPWLTVKMSTNHANGSGIADRRLPVTGVESRDNFLTVTLFSSLRQEHCSVLSCRDERMKWFDTEESLRVVAQSKSSCRCRGPVKRLRHDRAWRSLTVKMGGDRCMLTDVLGGFAPIPEMSPDLQFCIDEMRMYVNRGLPCIRFQTMTLWYARERSCYSVSGLGGLWKHQNNPACTRNVKSVQGIEAGPYTQEEERLRI